MVEYKVSDEQSSIIRAHLRLYQSSDAGEVASLVGPTLDALYPQGRGWLDQKLEDVESGKAVCTLAELNSHLAGLTIETIKSPDRRKLSTIWVNESARGHGVGTQLAHACLHDWLENHVNDVRVTARLRVAGGIARLLVPVGFMYRALERDRYGTGQHELVLAWTPDSVRAASDLEWVKKTLSEIERRLLSATEP
jgi:ribosomal protein S18 acetylase RimI-like enzyme